jgi:hypothetical protein
MPPLSHPRLPSRCAGSQLFSAIRKTALACDLQDSCGFPTAILSKSKMKAVAVLSITLLLACGVFLRANRSGPPPALALAVTPRSIASTQINSDWRNQRRLPRRQVRLPRTWPIKILPEFVKQRKRPDFHDYVATVKNHGTGKARNAHAAQARGWNARLPEANAREVCAAHRRQFAA